MLYILCAVNDHSSSLALILKFYGKNQQKGAFEKTNVDEIEANIHWAFLQRGDGRVG